jgi:outer membrane protein
MANDLGSILQTKVQSIEQEVTRRGNKLQSDVNAFQEKIDKGLLTRSTAEAQNEKLVKQQNDFQTYYNQKQQEVAEEQAVTMNQIANAIKEYIDKFNEDKQYALIIATAGDILPQPIVAGDPELDITDILIEGLNAEYIRTKNQAE